MSHPGSRTPHKLIQLFFWGGPLFTVLLALWLMGHAEGYFWCGPCPQQTGRCQGCILMYIFTPPSSAIPGAMCSSEQGESTHVGGSKPLTDTKHLLSARYYTKFWGCHGGRQGYGLCPHGAGSSILIPNPSFPERNRPSCEFWRDGSALPSTAKETEVPTPSLPPSSQEPSQEIASVHRA